MNDIDTKQVALRCVAEEPHEIHSWEDVSSTTVTTQLFNGNYTCPSNDTIVLYRHIIWWTNSGQPTYIQATDLNTSYEGPIHNQSVFIV